MEKAGGKGSKNTGSQPAKKPTTQSTKQSEASKKRVNDQDLTESTRPKKRPRKSAPAADVDDDGMADAGSTSKKSNSPGLKAKSQATSEKQDTGKSRASSASTGKKVAHAKGKSRAKEAKTTVKVCLLSEKYF